MKKILTGALITLALGVNDPILADSNTEVETKKWKADIVSVLEEKPKYSHQEEIIEFERFFQEDILIEYKEDPRYFWEYFGYVSAPEACQTDMMEDVLWWNIDNYDLSDLWNKLDIKFGENAHKAYFDYLFLLSLGESWNMESQLFQENNEDTYFILTEDLIDYFHIVWFEIVGNIDSYNSFTFRKLNDGSIEMLSIAPGGLKIIWKLPIENIEKIKNQTYSIMDFIFEYKGKSYKNT